MLAAVIHPHPIRLLAQDNTMANFAACPLDAAAPATSTVAAVTTAMGLFAVVSVLIELAQAEARTFRQIIEDAKRGVVGRV